VSIGIDLSRPPRHRPVPGQVLDLEGRDVRWRSAPLRFRVEKVRLDISQWYGGNWVWLEGRELHPTQGHPMIWLQLLVNVDAIPPDTPPAANDQPIQHPARAPAAGRLPAITA
jgi:hypothetical protein